MKSKKLVMQDGAKIEFVERKDEPKFLSLCEGLIFYDDLDEDEDNCLKS